MSWYRFEPKPSVAQRRVKAVRDLEKLKGRDGRALQPVVIEGRQIARTFWGKAWCSNLESYRDFEYRLPRGRSYARHRAILDLQVKPGQVKAVVSGSALYDIEVEIAPLAAQQWVEIRRQCAGEIGSVIELLEGRFSDHVMRLITDLNRGLFPRPNEIRMRCSCPDWAVMCKHVAAAMYGFGARLDDEPELLFTLRRLDHTELITAAADMGALTGGTSSAATIDSADLSAVFGIDLDVAADDAAASLPPSSAAPRSGAIPARLASAQRTKKKVNRKKASRQKVAGRKVSRKRAPGKKIASKAGAAKQKVASSAGGNGTKKVAKKDDAKETGTQGPVARKAAVKKTEQRTTGSRETVRKKSATKKSVTKKPTKKSAAKKAGKPVVRKRAWAEGT